MTTKNVPLEPTEAMIDAGDDMAEVTASVTAIYKAMLASSPPSGGEVAYQMQGSDGSWCDVPLDVFGSCSSVKGRTVYTSPRVVDDEMVMIALRGYDSKLGQSKFEKVRAALQAALGEGK